MPKRQKHVDSREITERNERFELECLIRDGNNKTPVLKVYTELEIEELRDKKLMTIPRVDTLSKLLWFLLKAFLKNPKALLENTYGDFDVCNGQNINLGMESFKETKNRLERSAKEQFELDTYNYERYRELNNKYRIQ